MVEHISTNTGPEENTMPLSPSELPHQLLGLPWQFLVLGLALCLIFSALGFRRVEYFVSLGYAASIAAQAVAFPFLYRDTIRGLALLQAGLLLAYGLRLGIFLALRDRVPSFQKQQAESTQRFNVGGTIKVAIWVGVSFFYVLLFLPALLTMSAQAGGMALASAPMGIVLMSAGLGLEACADWQKSEFKKRNPSRFCDVGLYSVVRFPNYFGEMVFWLGVWVSAMSTYRSLAAWSLGSLGLMCIVLVMVGASRRLELKQSKTYASNAAYEAYVRRVPILLPFLPIYSLRSPKVRQS
jgi:steroid 5-alpha reductase family enzyme